jgi:hypothetical protein
MIKLLGVFFITCILVSIVYNLLLNATFKGLKTAAKVVVIAIFSALILTIIGLTL